MFNPQSIDPLSLPSLPLEERSLLPQIPCIYFVINPEGAIHYIGRSVNPRARWQNHHRYNDLQVIGSVRIAYLFVDSPDLLPEIESALIHWFSPPLNAKGKQFPTYSSPSVSTSFKKDRDGLLEKMTTTSVTIPESLLTWFQEYCKKQKRSVSAQISFMIEQLKETEGSESRDKNS